MKLSAFFLGSNIVNFWNIEEGPGQIERDIVAEMDDKIDDASIEARSKFLEGTEQAQSDAALKIAQTINSLLENYPDIDPKDEKLAKRFKASWEDINNTAIFVGQDFIDLVISKLKRIGQESAGDLEKHREIIELWLYLKTEK